MSHMLAAVSMATSPSPDQPDLQQRLGEIAHFLLAVKSEIDGLAKSGSEHDRRRAKKALHILKEKIDGLATALEESASN